MREAKLEGVLRRRPGHLLHRSPFQDACGQYSKIYIVESVARIDLVGQKMGVHIERAKCRLI